MEAKTIQERIADVIAKTCTDYVDAYRMDEKTAQILTRVLAAEFGAKHTYNPATHVVVSREAGKAASETIERCLGDGFRQYFDCDELESNNNALAELRAALEVRE